MVPRPLAAARAMRSCTCADVIQPCCLWQGSRALSGNLSGLVQHRKSEIHGLPVKSGKSDWLRIRNEYSAHTQKIGSSQSSRSLPQARRIVGSGDENVRHHDRAEKRNRLRHSPANGNVGSGARRFKMAAIRG